MPAYSNVVLVGGVGLGKSHLVTALGLRACECAHSVLFTSAIDAINTLADAKAAGQLKRDLANVQVWVGARERRGKFGVWPQLGCWCGTRVGS